MKLALLDKRVSCVAGGGEAVFIVLSGLNHDVCFTVPGSIPE